MKIKHQFYRTISKSNIIYPEFNATINLNSFFNKYSKKEAYQLNTYDEDQGIILNAVDSIRQQIKIHSIKETEQSRIGKLLSRFDAFKEYPMVVLFDAYQINLEKPFYLVVLSTSSNVERVVSRNQINRETIVEHEFVGFAKLNRNYGQAYIRPKSFADKISSIFMKNGLQINADKKFFQNYIVTSTSDTLFEKNCKPEMLNSLANYKGIEVEIIEDLIMVRTRSRISKKNAFKIVNILGRICNGEN